MTAASLVFELTIASDRANLRYARELLEPLLWDLAYTEHDVFAIGLALEEALVNAIIHGNQNDPAKRVQIAFKVTVERFDVRIEDEGPGFTPDDSPDPTAPVGLERPCGRGLLLMRGFMTEVQFHGRGNVVTMSKVREGAQSPEAATPPADSDTGESPMTTELTTTSDLAELREVPDLIEQALRGSAYSEYDIFGIKLALEEALVNAIKYDNQMDPDKQIHIAYTITPERYEISVTAEDGEDRSIMGSRS